MDKVVRRKFKGTLAKLDKDCKVKLSDKPVLVTLDFNPAQIVGFAKVWKSNNELKYEIEIFEDKTIASEVLVPCLKGKVLEKQDKVVKSFSVEGIGLSSTPSDSRLEPLSKGEIKSE